MSRPPAPLRPRVAPTGVWRGHAVAGIVNDASAYKLGGVSGNAGLFSTAGDVARFAQFVLRGGALPDGRRLLRPETVRLFTTKAVDFGGGAEARAPRWPGLPTGGTRASVRPPFGARRHGPTRGGGGPP